jgi:hypothetical protein
MLRISVLLLLLPACATPAPEDTAQGELYPVAVEVEGGLLWQGRNDIRIPGDTGTSFAMEEATGDGPFPVGRLTADWDIDDSHAIRAVYAPIDFEGSGSLRRDTSFAGTVFDGGVPIDGSYKFSSYRLGYRYTFLRDERWRLRFGGTLFVRDAEIELVQGNRRASDSDLGVVPLLNFAAEYRPADRWRLVGEIDGLASGQGRAFDVTLRGYYDVTDRFSLGLAYRTIEGGADNDDVYNFAWLHSVVFAATFRF